MLCWLRGQESGGSDEEAGKDGGQGAEIKTSGMAE